MSLPGRIEVRSPLLLLLRLFVLTLASSSRLLSLWERVDFLDSFEYIVGLTLIIMVLALSPRLVEL